MDRSGEGVGVKVWILDLVDNRILETAAEADMTTRCRLFGGTPQSSCCWPCWNCCLAISFLTLIVEVSLGSEALLVTGCSESGVFLGFLRISSGLYVSELPSLMVVTSLESRRALGEDQSESR